MIIPTQEKAALRFPYTHLSVKFTDVLRETFVLFVIGNSLRDVHIRNFIQTRIATLNVVLINPNAEEQKKLFPDYDRVHALKTGIIEFIQSGIHSLRILIAQLATHKFPDPENVRILTTEFVKTMQHAIDLAAQDKVSPEVAQLIKEAMEGSLAVRSRAIRQLGNHAHQRVRRELRQLASKEDDPVIRVSAIDSLLKVDGPNAVDAIGQVLLESKDESVRIEALLALNSLAGSSEARSFIQRAKTETTVTPGLQGIISEIGE
jgi:HEAT repeats